MSQGAENQSVEQAAAPASVPAPEPPADLAPFAPPRNKRRPLVGGALWTFGALLWAYLVMGELVVNFEVSELLAGPVVMAALGLAWYGAVRHAPADKIVHKVAPGGIGILLFFVTLLFAASVFGTTRQKSIEALTVAFWFPASLAYVLGRRFVQNPKLELSRRQKAGAVALWVVSSLVTAIAMLSAMTRM